MSHNNNAAVEKKANLSETTQERPATIGEVFPGLHGQIHGVPLSRLSLGLLEPLLLSGMAREFSALVSTATRDLTERDTPKEFAAAKALALAAGTAFFEENILPSTAESAHDHSHAIATEYLRSNMEKQAARHPGGAEEFMAAWYAARFTEEEKEAADKKNSRSRVLCMRRLGRKWLTMDLPAAAAAQREKILVAAQERAIDSNSAARARVLAREKTIFNPHTPSAALAETFDETDLGI